MSEIYCIGRIGGNEGDWYARVDFKRSEAVIMERTKTVERGPVAFVPLGKHTGGDDNTDPQLDPDDAQNKALMKIIYAPEAFAVLDEVRKKLYKLFHDEDTRPALADEAIYSIDRIIERLTVPHDDAVSKEDAQ